MKHNFKFNIDDKIVDIDVLDERFVVARMYSVDHEDYFYVLSKGGALAWMGRRTVEKYYKLA